MPIRLDIAGELKVGSMAPNFSMLSSDGRQVSLPGLRGKRVVLYTGGVKSWSVISAAKDLGIEVVATSTRKSTEEDKARIRKLIGNDGIMMEKGNAKELLQLVKDTKADMLIAGGRNQYTALKARIPFLDINQERHHPYAGYVGMVEMARELYEALYSPVWEQIRKPAPWDKDTETGGHGDAGTDAINRVSTASLALLEDS